MLPGGATAGSRVQTAGEANEEISAARDGSPLTAEERHEGVLSLRRLVDVANNVKLLEPGDVRLVGTLDEGLPGVQVAPAAAQSRRATLVVANLRFGERQAEPDENLRPVHGPTNDITP